MSSFGRTLRRRHWKTKVRRIRTNGDGVGTRKVKKVFTPSEGFDGLMCIDADCGCDGACGLWHPF